MKGKRNGKEEIVESRTSTDQGPIVQGNEGQVEFEAVQTEQGIQLCFGFTFGASVTAATRRGRSVRKRSVAKPRGGARRVEGGRKAASKGKALTKKK